MGNDLGRHVLGAAAIAFGVIALAGHDFDTWQQLRSLWSRPHGEILVSTLAAAEIAGGIALQWRRTARSGAIALGIVYLFFALRWIPGIIAKPQAYDSWGNLFEQLSIISGAMIVYGAATPELPWSSRICQAGRYLFGICVVSFTLEQLFYLRETATFVPKWIPPGQMFWAITTTIALALGALAILSGRVVLLASRLLTIMMVGFALLMWLPRLVSNPHDHMNWGGNAQNLAITAASWIVTDFLGRARLTRGRGAPAHPERLQTS